VISLTAKQLNPKIKVVSRCSSAKNIEKMEKVGADSVVTTASIGGLRMASVGGSVLGKTLSSLRLDHYPRTLVLAIKHGTDYLYNPPRNHRLKEGEILVIMTTPQERIQFENHMKSA
jgi:voltage-gated potassium channel